MRPTMLAHFPARPRWHLQSGNRWGLARRVGHSRAPAYTPTQPARSLRCNDTDEAASERDRALRSVLVFEPLKANRPGWMRTLVPGRAAIAEPVHRCSPHKSSLVRADYGADRPIFYRGQPSNR